MTVSQHPVISPKKLIEVALPLDVINEEGARRKRKAPGGYPTAFHKWWAQRPVAAARAVVFAQLVNDPEDLWRHQNPGLEPKSQNRSAWTRERARLFKIIEDLVSWDNTQKPHVFASAKEEIYRSWRAVCDLNTGHPQAKELFDPQRMPGIHDPFAGGGTIPVESLRLGLDSLGTDLNPVAVLINKAMLEIAPRFALTTRVSPDDRGDTLAPLRGREALAADVRYYGQWLREKAEASIGSLFPPVLLTDELVAGRPDLEHLRGKRLPVIAWLWARTVRSPSPVFSHAFTPLASTFVLCSKKGRQAYVDLAVSGDSFTFHVRQGSYPREAAIGTSLGKKKGFRCALSGAPITFKYLREEARAGRMGRSLMAMVAIHKGQRVYLSPSPEHAASAECAPPSWKPDLAIPEKALGFSVQNYDIRTYADLFTTRHLRAFTTFVDLLGEVHSRVMADAAQRGMSHDSVPFGQGGTGAQAYADAICVYLSCVMTRSLHFSTTNSSWIPKDSAIRSAFGKQVLTMLWDYAEANPFEQSSAGWEQCEKVIAKCIEFLPQEQGGRGEQRSATAGSDRQRYHICTDPPYYDNIGYADLSDFFYAWLRPCLRKQFPDLFSTMSVPKAEELVAAPHRHGSAAKAEQFFLTGMRHAFAALAATSHPAAPMVIFYAFKQSETKGDLTNSTGWETFLEAVVSSGLSVTGTWPVRTEADNRQRSQASNSLASSVVLICRARPQGTGVLSRRQFVRLLNEHLPLSLDAMTRESEGLPSPVAPVDLSQAIIGPGMSIFSRYEAVLEADGTPMTVKTALQLINRFLAEDDFDADTQFCLHWFEQHGWETGKFGEADTLARAKGTSVDGVKQSGVVEAGGGNVRLLRWRDYPTDWDARSDSRLPVWEALHQLIRAYQTEGDTGASKVLAAVASKAETSRQLAYRLYTLCERKGWAEDARAYNEVVTGWSSIETAAAKIPGPSQGILFDSTKETP